MLNTRPPPIRSIMHQDSPNYEASLEALTSQVNSGKKFGDRSFSGFPAECLWARSTLVTSCYPTRRPFFEEDIIFKNGLVRSINSFFVRFWKQTRGVHEATAFLCGMPLGWFSSLTHIDRHTSTTQGSLLFSTPLFFATYCRARTTLL